MPEPGKKSPPNEFRNRMMGAAQRKSSSRGMEMLAGIEETLGGGLIEIRRIAREHPVLLAGGALAVGLVIAATVQGGRMLRR